MRIFATATPCVTPRPDHHVGVGDWFDQLVEAGAERAGDDDELVDCDPALPGLDAAQRRGADVAASGERIE
jgi:hypothetical protein